MREHAANSQEIARPFDTMEFPRVAHMVADLDDLDGDERHPADVRPTYAASSEASVAQAWSLCRPFADTWANDDRPAEHAPRRSQVRAIYREAPSLRHTVFARAARLFPLLMIVLLGACASTGATFRSGVGDAFLEEAPYYAGAPAATVRATNARVGHLPVMFQRGASQPASFDPSSAPNSELAGLVADMNAYLATLGVSAALISPADATEGFGVNAVAPDVRFGCATEGNLPGGDCIARGDSALGRGRQTMHLAVGRPSDAWTARTSELMAGAGAGHTLVITLEVGQYLTKQSGWRGSKSVVLGTNHEESLPWLTSLETPVAVLQLTGALMDASGKAVRIGAEGIAAHPTRLLVSAVGAQELFGDEQVRKARSARRADLPGSPLAWQVALRDLVVQLTGSSR
jgi:hypothetical protein